MGHEPAPWSNSSSAQAFIDRITHEQFEERELTAQDSNYRTPPKSTKARLSGL